MPASKAWGTQRGFISLSKRTSIGRRGMNKEKLEDTSSRLIAVSKAAEGGLLR